MKMNENENENKREDMEQSNNLRYTCIVDSCFHKLCADDLGRMSCFLFAMKCDHRYEVFLNNGEHHLNQTIVMPSPLHESYRLE